MQLFTKPNCNKCVRVKALIIKLGMTGDITIRLYDPNGVTMENVEILADMAFYEIVGKSETMMPILVDKKGKSYAGWIAIKKKLGEVAKR